MQGTLRMAMAMVLLVLLGTAAQANVTAYVLTDGSNGNTATTSVAAAAPPVNNTTTVAGAATYVSINSDNGTAQYLNGGNNAIEAVQLVLAIGETPAEITSIDVKFSGYCTGSAGPLNLYIWNGSTWTSMGSMSLTTGDTTPTPVNYAGSFDSFVVGGQMYIQYVLPATGNPDLYVDYVAVDVNFTPANNSLLHNSVSTASTRWSGSGGWGIAGGKYGEFTCATCHQKSTGNIKRVKTTFAAPNGTDQFPIEADPTPPTVSFQDATEPTTDFGNDARADKSESSHVCEACHTYDAAKVDGVEFHGYNMTVPGDSGHYNQQDCMVCHPHSLGFKPQACDSCHGNPPTDTSSGGPNGLADTPNTTGSTTAGAHSTHAGTLSYGCSNCHSGYTMPETSSVKPGYGDISISFSNFGVTTGSYSGQSNVSYNNVLGSGTKTCSNVYCHSTGQSADGSSATPSAYSSPAWDGSAGCGSCHSSTDPATGAHTAHINDGAVCDDCHVGNSHVNHGIDVTTGTYTAGGTPGNGYGTCSTASCHDKGRGGLATTPTWSATPVTDCTECHAGAGISTGGHGAHVGVNFGGAVIDCADCHDAATDPATETAPASGHRDTNIDVVAGGYPTNKTKDTAFSTCISAVCHQTGQSANDYTTTSAWDADDANCTQCHEASPTDSSHTKHIVTVGANCSACHTNALKDTSYNDAAHGDLNIDVAVGGYTANRSLGGVKESCTLTCHSDGMAATGTSPVWGGSGGCAACHASDMATGSHDEHLAAGALCGDCHDGAVKDSNSGTAHADGNVDVTATYATANAAYGIASWTTCSSASCHDDGRTPNTSAAWGTTINNCAECHATVPATAGHATHLGKNFAGVAIACGDCHTGTTEGTTAGAGHRDGNIDAVGYATANKTLGTAYTNCTSASCHQDGLVDGTNYVATPAWDADTANCTQCHAAVPATGSHATHVTTAGYDCSACHTGATKDTSYAGAQHGDLNIDVAVGGYAADKAIASAYTGCTAVSCHSDGMAATGNAPTWGNSAGCTACHASDMATGSHDEHLAAGALCGDCHDGAVKDSNSGTAHADGNVDVTATYATANAAYGIASWTTCSSASCHDDGRTPNTSAAWGTTINNCAECHATVPATAGHATHLGKSFAGAAIACGDCHSGTTEGTTAGAGHRDGNIDAAGYATANKTLGTAYTNCTSASCHQDGLVDGTNYVATPAWDADTANCTQCHAAVPATGSHATHVTTAGYDCSACHTGATKDTSYAGAQHGDLNIDVAVGGYAADKAIASAYTGCTAVSCHSDGMAATGNAPTWGNSGDCTTCHASNMATGSHDEHLAAGALCGDCHSGAVKDSNPGSAHIDGNVDVVAGYATANATYGSGSWTTCNNASCHDNGTGTLATTPAWNTSSACGECHLALPTAGAHDKHFAAVGSIIAAAKINCATCHGDAVQATSPITGQHGVMGDGNLDVYDSAAGDLGYTANVASTAPTYNTETCNTSYCHGDNMPKGTTSGTTNAPTWGATSTGCTFCHDMAPLAISAHVGKSLTDCITCHGVGSGDVNATGTGFTNGGATHMDGVVQGGGDNCLDCHAGALGGVHDSHVDKDTFLAGKTVSGGDYGTNGWYTTTWSSGKPNFGCGECHPANEGTSHPISGLNLDMNPGGESPPATSPKSKNVDTPTTPTFSTGSSVTCQNVYCHSDALSAARTYALTPNWYGGTIGSNCTDCHANGPTSNAHQLHAVGIHYDTLYDDDGSGQMTAAAAPGTDAGAAHGNSATSDPIGCQTCHNSTVAVEYNSANTVCTTCHAGATGSPAVGDEKVIINTAGSTHVNAQPDVVFASLSGFKSKAQMRNDITTVTELNASWSRTNSYKGAAGTSHDAGSALTPDFTTGSCSAIVCHNNNPATWTDSNVSCEYCHTNLPQ